ncbi:LysM peptidoglycan-binding domain-containing protein [Neisseria sp. Dent CA1/247]|uniref:LysM peptidoglycan-binding domain-containing protein n=1 Tax=Neisseria sp. Dent CA1/247 TaxID=2912675 RepID=UPI001FCFE063|nr:LysM peptidoglycan-binding domain-containing protein [Neisseria sp. Dent CA1/247]UOO76470.1 LysM peptidoglycan-binding domain-containing protein [Neisseria sp. Dent CA1/247]
MANYRIEFLDAENNPMAGCHFQIMHYFQVLQDGIADSQGRGVFRSDLIKNKKIWLRFWGKGQTQESAFASQTFLWQENVVTQPVKAPTIYEVDLRETENNNNEPAEYRQAFYEVQAGDTWESIAEKCETEAVLIRLVNNLQDDAPLEVGDALLLPRGAKRPLKQSLANKEVMPSIEADALHKVLLELEEKKDKKSKAPEPTQPPIQDNLQTVPEAKKEPAPQLPKQQEPPKKPKLDKMRSAENGKPEEKAIPNEICFCNRDLTLKELKMIFTSQKIDKIIEYLPLLNQTMAEYGILSCIEKIHFLAQIGHESASLKYTEEILPKGTTEDKAYGGYKGRGLIQLTFRDGYESYGKHIRMDLLGQNKYLLAKPKLASNSAGWYWSLGNPLRTNLNKFADENDLIKISVVVNGGFNGFNDRLSYLKRGAYALNIHSCKKNTKNNKYKFDNFQLEDSAAFSNAENCLAWGIWHDPNTNRKGVNKNLEEAKKGYKQFLNLRNKVKLTKKRYGKPLSYWISFAESRLK